MSNENDDTLTRLNEDRAKLREIAGKIRSSGTQFAVDEFFSKAEIRWELIHDPILRFAELAYRNAEMLSNEYNGLLDRVWDFLTSPSSEQAGAVILARDGLLEKTHQVHRSQRDWFIARHQSAWNLSEVSTATFTDRGTDNDD